ncbi:MAG: hypothetical protein LBI10_03725 [Deltaproteobacteria bacterium]|nr:hypothetical protein [Deltaproteobacteria bacterium]
MENIKSDGVIFVESKKIHGYLSLSWGDDGNKRSIFHPPKDGKAELFGFGSFTGRPLLSNFLV